MEILLHDHKRGLSEVATTPQWLRQHGQKADVDGMFWAFLCEIHSPEFKCFRVACESPATTRGSVRPPSTFSKLPLRSMCNGTDSLSSRLPTRLPQRSEVQSSPENPTKVSSNSSRCIQCGCLDCLYKKCNILQT
jgi:hypothetical protein